MRDDKTLLDDVLERAMLIDSFVAAGREAFFQSRMMQEAVIRSLEIIGEAVGQLSEDLRSTHREIPWPRIIAFRNFVIHTYWQIKLERVWEIVQTDLPNLRSAIEQIIRELPSDDSPDEQPSDA